MSADVGTAAAPRLRVGLISDTHGLLRPEALAQLRGCDHIVHAGDIGSPAIVDALAAMAPLVAVRGNNDTAPWAEASAAIRMRPACIATARCCMSTRAAPGHGASSCPSPWRAPAGRIRRGHGDAAAAVSVLAGTGPHGYAGGPERHPAMDAPFRILDIDHLVLRVADLDRMLGFYVGVLGCRIERRRDDIGLVQLRAGRSLIDLVPVQGPLGRAGGAAPGPQGRNMDHFCLRIEPFDEAAMRERLAAHGVAAGALETRFGAEGEGPSIYLDDPEGNVVELKGPLARPGPA